MLITRNPKPSESIWESEEIVCVRLDRGVKKSPLASEVRRLQRRRFKLQLSEQTDRP